MLWGTQDGNLPYLSPTFVEEDLTTKWLTMVLMDIEDRSEHINYIDAEGDENKL